MRAAVAAARMDCLIETVWEIELDCMRFALTEDDLEAGRAEARIAALTAASAVVTHPARCMAEGEEDLSVDATRACFTWLRQWWWYCRMVVRVLKSFAQHCFSWYPAQPLIFTKVESNTLL